MKILILGHTGYIGNELYKNFVKQNFYTVGVSRTKLTIDNKNIDNNIFKNKRHLNKILNNSDVIINCLGEVKNEQEMMEINVNLPNRIQRTISYIAKKYKKKTRWIQISTIGVYGFDGNGPKKQIIDNDTIENPLSFYEQTKFKAEKNLKRYSSSFFSYTILRIGTVIAKQDSSIFFDKLIFLIKNNIFFFIETNKTILNIIYLDDLINIIIKCVVNQKSVNKIYNVSNNFKLADLVLLLKKNFSFIHKIIIPEKIAKFIYYIFFFFKIKKKSIKLIF
jgi:nucleoside-diphosphate-sugar epimerase